MANGIYGARSDNCCLESDTGLAEMHGVCVMLSQVTSAAPVQLNETYSLVKSQCPETKPCTFAIWLRGCFGAYAQIGEPNSTSRLVAHI